MATIGAAAGLAAFSAWAVRGRSSRLFGPSIWRGPRDRRVIALTFDDGPSPGTADLLELLDRHRVRATFFLCGANARRHRSIAADIVAAGHETGNHTETHAPLWLRSPRFVRSEIERAQHSITDASGLAPRWFRPPFGVRWFGMREALHNSGLLNVMWSSLARDWRLPAAAVARRVVGGAANGAIVCLHDGRQMQPFPDIANTLEAVRTAIPILLEQGWTFVTIGELLRYSNPLCPRTSSGA
jgi:peptidoglycan/xylan/chitin deacetylase (PgdA/CDA1 family)